MSDKEIISLHPRIFYPLWKRSPRSIIISLLIFFLFLILSISISKSIIFWGTLIFKIWALEPASSKTSIALSGKNLSLMYFEESSTAERMDSSEYLTLW